MEEITEGWRRLSLQGPEGDGFSLRPEMGSEEFILAAKFFTRRVLNTDAIARNFSQLWRSRNGFKIKDMGNHIILFIFDNKLDTDRVLASQPWSFDKFLVAIQRYDKNTPVRDLVFDRVPIWVQVYDIPIRFANKGVAEGICSGIGDVCPAELSVMEGGDFWRVRVIIDISKPLSRGRKITLDDGSAGWVSFKYERLPNICYWCGCITHGDKDCELWIESEGTLSVESRQYGAWLRAPLFNPSRRSTVVVPGFYKQKKESSPPTTSGGSVSTPKKQNPPVSQPAPAEHVQKVTPDSSPPIITNLFSNNDSRICEDFPPGFEGQNFKKGNFTRQLQEIDEDLSKFDGMEGIDMGEELLPTQDSSTPLHPNSPESHAIQNPILAVNQVFPIAESKSAESPLRAFSALQGASPQVTFPPGHKWTRIVRTAPGISEILDVHAGEKRVLLSALNHRGLPKKSKLVSQDDIEHNLLMAAAGSQPRQGP